MRIVKKSAVIARKAEFQVHGVARKSWAYRRFGHVGWLNRIIKFLIAAMTWLVVAVIILELTVGVTGLMILYYLYRSLVG